MCALTQQKTVLIIDDLPETLDLLTHILTEANFRVLLAESGQRALQLLQEAARQALLPDIILLDISMTGLDGFETCRQIKAMPVATHIPILFITAHDASVDKVRGFDVGGADYITKPLDFGEVQARINTHLTLSRLQQELQLHNTNLKQELQNHIVQLQVELENRRLATEQLSTLMEERDKLLKLVCTQSDHLRDIANSVLATQSEQRQSLLHIIQEQIAQKLSSALFYLEAAETTITNTWATEECNDHVTPQRNLRKSKNILQEVIDHTAKLSQDLAGERPRTMGDNPLLTLSARERETLELIASGKSNSEIAGILYVAEATVRTHRARIMHKLSAKTNYDLARIVLEHSGR
jgi:DNA-binding response OmpR family regulator/DNA-binding CsgD family transcriptional regulator